MISNISLNFLKSTPHYLKTFNYTAYQLFRWTDSVPQTKHILNPSPKTLKIQELPTDKKGSITAPWAANFRQVKANRAFLEDPMNEHLEYLVKVQLCHSLCEGKELQIGDKFYIVHRKISGKGLVSYAIKPSGKNPNLQPFILFRCTETNPFKEESFNSVQNDIDPSLGERGWNATKEQFEKLMNDPSFRRKDQKVKIAGYSLGGAHAQYFLSEHHAAVSHGIFYNNPSIKGEIAEKFAKKIETTHRDSPLILQIFRTQGDPFHLFGEKHLGCDLDHPNISVQLLEVDVLNQQNFDLKLHSKRLFKTDQLDYTVNEYINPAHLSKKLNNTKRSPISSFFEALRRKCSGFLSLALYAIRSIFRAFFSKKR